MFRNLFKVCIGKKAASCWLIYQN